MNSFAVRRRRHGAAGAVPAAPARHPQQQGRPGHPLLQEGPRRLLQRLQDGHGLRGGVHARLPLAQGPAPGGGAGVRRQLHLPLPLRRQEVPGGVPAVHLLLPRHLARVGLVRQPLHCAGAGGDGAPQRHRTLAHARALLRQVRLPALRVRGEPPHLPQGGGAVPQPHRGDAVRHPRLLVRVPQPGPGGVRRVVHAAAAWGAARRAVGAGSVGENLRVLSLSAAVPFQKMTPCENSSGTRDSIGSTSEETSRDVKTSEKTKQM